MRWALEKSWGYCVNFTCAHRGLRIPRDENCISIAAIESIPRPHISAAVSGSFFTRLGIAGVPFLLLWLVTGPCLGHSISRYAWVAAASSSTHSLAALDGHSRGKG
jgi:hypothetical protein